MRVGVIDSGVNLLHPHIGPIAGGISVGIDGDLHQGFTDLLGHGTAVIAAIQEKAPLAEYFAVRVFEGELRTSASALRSALNWCLENKMDVINLSLGTANQAHAAMFTEAVARASQMGVLIVAAREANGTPCYPGCLPGVFAVDADRELPRDCYRFTETEGRFVITASGYPRPVPGVPPHHNLQGVSFAVANASGFVIQACSRTGQRESASPYADKIGDALRAATRL